MNYKLKYVSVKGHPMVQIICEEPVDKFVCDNNEIRKVKVISTNVLQVPAAMICSFIDWNKKLFGNWIDAKIDSESIEKYYCFEDYNDNDCCSVKLSEKYLEKWCNCDCPRLTRYMPNTNNHVNVLGMYIPEFSETLFESSFYDVSVGDLDEDEIQSFQNALNRHKGHYSLESIVDTINNRKEANEKAIEEIEKSVSDYEKKVSSIIEKYSKEIEDYQKTLPDRSFDCGFTVIRTADLDINKKIKFLIDIKKRSSLSLKVDFPDDYFNCSNSRDILEYIKKLSAKNIDDKNILDQIYVKTILD